MRSLLRTRCTSRGESRAWQRAFVVIVLFSSTLLAARTGGTSFEQLMDSVQSARTEGRFDRTFFLLKQLREQALGHKDRQELCRVQVEEAWLYHTLGDFNKALRLLYSTERMRKELGDRRGLAEVYNHIGAIQQVQKNHERALEQYERSLSIYQELGLKLEIGRSFNNLGSLYEDMGRPEEAIAYHRKSEEVWHQLNATEWMAITYMQLGSCMDEMGRSDSARLYYTKSLGILNGLGRDHMDGVIYTHIGESYLRSGDHAEAVRWCERGLAASDEKHQILIQQNACECLYRAYEGLGMAGRALAFHKRFVLLRDSVFGQENVKELTRIEMAHGYAQQHFTDSLLRSQKDGEADLRHREEVAQERNGRNLAIFGAVAVLGLSGAMWSRLRYIRRSRAVIQKERDRSEALLLNILPEEVAQELKDTGSAQAREVAEVSILFTDFRGFTALSEKLSAQDLVAEIDVCFKAFDAILTRYDVEKIKTIGDAYMAAGGLPMPRAGAVVDTVRAALEMQVFLIERANDRRSKGLAAFEMRAGIHTGAVVAGVVGMKKFQYDIWGDTVNTASRMESAGQVGKVNISEATYELVKHALDPDGRPAFEFDMRGKVKAKGKGEVEMFFVRRRRGEG